MKDVSSHEQLVRFQAGKKKTIRRAILVRSRALLALLVFVLGTSLIVSSCMSRSSLKNPQNTPPEPAIKQSTPSPEDRQEETQKPRVIKRVVKATAYNAMQSQTDSTPTICAWGDSVRPGIIAVSRDLERIGLTRGKEVHVEGIGKLVVLDRMHRRKTNQIDIFMETYDEAIRFGVQELKISWITDRGNDPANG